MKDQIEKLITYLKIQIKANLDIINKNNEKLKNLSNINISDDEKEKLIKKLNEENKKLMEENNDCINLQINLSNFLNKYRFSKSLNTQISIETTSLLTENEIFYLTINNKVVIDCNHPALKNENLFNKLLEYYTKIENYEKCKELLEFKKKNFSTLNH